MITHRNAICTIVRAINLQKYLDSPEVNATTSAEDKERNLRLVRIEAREAAGSTDVPDGCDAELMQAIGELKGTPVSTLVEIADTTKQAAFIDKINAKAGAKVGFSIYSLSIAEYAESIGQVGKVVITDGTNRYTKLTQVYFGYDDGTREADAKQALIKNVRQCLAGDYKLVGEEE